MKRLLVRCLLSVLLGLAGATISLAQEGQTPGGYQFFARRNRPTPTTWTRIVEPASVKSSKRQAACCKIGEDNQTPPSPIPRPSEATPSPTATEQQAVRQVNWGAEFGLGYGWPEEGYYPGTPSYGFGKSYPYPLHGYRETYDWAGNTYSMHCYCSKGYCPYHCPGYRGECYVPCWNDAGTPIIERRCGRGSGFDCFWHMGGYEWRCRKTDCPNICQGPPAYSSFGFPRGSVGDPNYVKPQGNGPGEPWRMSHDPYGTAPATKARPVPANPAAPPQPAAETFDTPTPMPQP